MNALLRTTIHSLWLCGTRVSCGHVRSSPLDIVRSYACAPYGRVGSFAMRNFYGYAFGFLHSVRPATAASRRPRYAHS